MRGHYKISTQLSENGEHFGHCHDPRRVRAQTARPQIQELKIALLRVFQFSLGKAALRADGKQNFAGRSRLGKTAQRLVTALVRK